MYVHLLCFFYLRKYYYVALSIATKDVQDVKEIIDVDQSNTICLLVNMVLSAIKNELVTTKHTKPKSTPVKI